MPSGGTERSFHLSGASRTPWVHHRRVRRLTGSVMGFSGSQLQAVAEASGVDVIRRHGGCVRCPILREKQAKASRLKPSWRRLRALDTERPVWSSRYLDSDHAVPGVQPTDASQTSFDVVSGGVPGQIQALCLFGVRHHTPGH